MEMIAAKTPEMVHKEIWMHLLSYNLLFDLDVAIAPQVRSHPRLTFRVLGHSSISSSAVLLSSG